MIHYRVQNAPGREEPLARLLSTLPPSTEVITDRGEPPANPWRGYQACLSDLPKKASHVAVFQDDAIACANIDVALERIVERWPDNLIVLFLPGAARATSRDFLFAQQRNQPYCDLSMRDFLPVVSVVWPVGKARAFLEWASTAELPGMPRPVRSDDAVGGLWQRSQRERVIVTVPSLVQHPDDVPSTVGQRAKDGRDLGRVAVSWIGDSDPLKIDWS